MVHICFQEVRVSAQQPRLAELPSPINNTTVHGLLKKKPSIQVQCVREDGSVEVALKDQGVLTMYVPAA